MNRKISWILGVLGGLLGLLAGIGFLLREPLKEAVQEFRSERLAEQAREAFAEENWEAAARQGRAAYYLDRDDKSIQLLVARALLQQRSETAVDWWKLVVEEPDLPVEELRTLTEALLARGDTEDGLLFLARLVELDADNPETQRLWLRALREQRRYRNYATLTQDLVDRGSEDWRIHRDFLRLRGGNENKELVIDHLQELMEEEEALALRAARELVVLGDASPEVRKKAAAYLAENAEDRLDRLYADSLAIRLEEKPFSAVESLFREVAEQPEDGELSLLLDWAQWMAIPERFFEEVHWESYRTNGGSATAYLGTLAELGQFRKILEVAESAGEVARTERPALLYFRSIALLETGQEDRAQETLQLAVDTVDPNEAQVLERLLIRGGYWGLLTDLYDQFLKNNPDSPSLLFKNLTADYYTGKQERLRDLLQRFQEAEEDPMLEQQTLELYLSLLLEGPDSRTHQKLEELMAAYPQVYDVRLVVGLSWLLQNRAAVGVELVEGIPAMDTAAPRHLRVAAILLGGDREELLAPGEWGQLLDRERFLISARRAQSVP